MKNIPELSCAIVEDLLPTYVERLTSEETNMAVEAHLASCPACAAKRAAMGAKETEAAAKDAEETAREVDYLKKVKRRGWKRAALAVLCTAAVLAASVVSGLTGLELDGWMGLGVALFILWSGVGILKETVDPLLGEAPSEELTDYIGKKVMSYDGVLGTHDLMVHDYGPGRRFASVHVEMAAENDVMQSHDVIDNIERDFQENDHISLIIHYDPILTGDDAVGTAREWVKELVRSISPELSIHDFRMVQGPSHTNLIFDTVVPHNFPLSDAALRKRIQSLVETHDAGETKYYAVVTIDHSYAAIPGACKTDGKE